jgi:hypothetical protein
MMKNKNIWKHIKQRYRLPAKAQMSFEISFLKYEIARCWFKTADAYQVRIQKITPSLKGIVLSDTIPLSWFTSSALIPWKQFSAMSISDTGPSIEGILDMPLSYRPDKGELAAVYCTAQLNDPLTITLDLPWLNEFTKYVQTNNLYDL